MKNKIFKIIICLLIFCLGIILGILIANNKNNYDVNKDGVVDSADLLDIRLYLLSH